MFIHTIVISSLLHLSSQSLDIRLELNLKSVVKYILNLYKSEAGSSPGMERPKISLSFCRYSFGGSLTERRGISHPRHVSYPLTPPEFPRSTHSCSLLAGCSGDWYLPRSEVGLRKRSHSMMRDSVAARIVPSLATATYLFIFAATVTTAIVLEFPLAPDFPVPSSTPPSSSPSKDVPSKHSYSPTYHDDNDSFCHPYLSPATPSPVMMHQLH